MITLTAKIVRNSLFEGEIGTLSVGATTKTNNISTEVIDNIKGKKGTQDNPFFLGASRLGDGSKFTTKSKSFICKPDTFCSIAITGGDEFVIAFDLINNRYPETISVNRKSFTLNSPIFKFNEKITQYDITINNWNAEGFPMVISGIYALDPNVNITLSNIVSLNRNANYRGDNKLPSFGILSNGGDLEFNDTDGTILEYAENQILTSDMDVEILLNNTLSKKSEVVARFKTKEWQYDNDNRLATVGLKDDLEEWQDIQVKGINYDPRQPFKIIEKGLMSNVYKWLQAKDENGKERTPIKYQMLSFDELDEETKGILENTRSLTPVLEDGTLWEQWTKLCEVCGLYIYKNKQGRTVCSYNLGV